MEEWPHEKGGECAGPWELVAGEVDIDMDIDIEVELVGVVDGDEELLHNDIIDEKDMELAQKEADGEVAAGQVPVELVPLESNEFSSTIQSSKWAIDRLSRSRSAAVTVRQLDASKVLSAQSAP